MKFHERAEIHIGRPVAAVYAFLSDPQNRRLYDPTLREVRQSSEGPVQVGMRIGEVRSMLGQTREMVTEVIAVDPLRMISYRTLPEDPFVAYGSYFFAASQTGTRLTLDFTLAPSGLRQLIVPIMQGKLRRDIAQGLQNIKSVLESEAAGYP